MDELMKIIKFLAKLWIFAMVFMVTRLHNTMFMPSMVEEGNANTAYVISGVLITFTIWLGYRFFFKKKKPKGTENKAANSQS